MKKIAIIEYNTNLDDSLVSFPLQDSLYLSVSAEASYCLSKKNIKFVTDEDILKPEEFKSLGDENFIITERWVQQLEEALQRILPVCAKKQFYPFKWHFYRLKALVDAVRIRYILLERLIEKEGPLFIGAPVGITPEHIRDQHLFFHKYDSLYGFLAQKIAEQKGIKINLWKTPKENSGGPLPADGISTSFRRLIRELKIFSKYKSLLGYAQGSILIGNLVYDIGFIRQQLSGKFNFYYYKDPFNITSLNSFSRLKGRVSDFPSLDMQDVFSSFSITGNSVVNDILGKRVQAFGEKFIPFLWNGFGYLESVDHRKNFKAYIHHAGAGDSFSGLPVYYFGRENKPVIIIQHGAYGFALNRLTEYSEFNHDGYFFAWGNGVADMYETRKKGECKFIITGSPIIEKIRKRCKRRNGLYKVCYIPGIYRGYTAYYPNGQPCLDSKVFLMEREFLLALKPYLSKFEITYKVAGMLAKHSSLLGKSPMLDWIKENLSGIKVDSRFLQSIVHQFDLFIIDFPSTPLIETLATFAEVLVYVGNNYYRLSADDIELLKKRAIVGLNEEDFKEKIRLVLDKGRIISNVEDTSFLKKYGVYLNDGKSLQRMAGNIVEIIKVK